MFGSAERICAYAPICASAAEAQRLVAARERKLKRKAHHRHGLRQERVQAACVIRRHRLAPIFENRGCQHQAWCGPR
jgi:hypothetical protein